MPTLISVSHTSQQSPVSDGRSGDYTDDTTSSEGTGVHVSKHEDSDHSDEDWEGIDSYSDEIEPSESASRPRPGTRYRSSSRPAASRRAPTRRHTTTDRPEHHSAGHRLQSRRPAPESSLEDYDQYPGYSRPYPPQPPYAGRGGYPQSHVGGFGANPFQAPPAAHAGQLTRFDSPYQQYPPGNPFQPPAGTGSYFPPGHPAAASAPHFTGHEMMPYGAAAPGYPFPSPYGLPPGLPPQYYPGYIAPSPPPVVPTPAPAPAPPVEREPDPVEEAKRKELEAQIKALTLESEGIKKEKAEKAAADLKAKEDAAAKAIADQRIKDEIEKHKRDVEEAALKAELKKIADAEKAKQDEEDRKKTEADIKTKVEAELKAEMAAKAEADAKALAAQAPPPPEKKAPIKFKDAVGRKFSFPFHLCQTWAGMEDLIRQAFMHVDVIGPHVADGHYDLVGPNGEIILPQVWETMIEPDWAITMHMWPMPERPRPEGHAEEPVIIEPRRRRERPTVGGPAGRNGRRGDGPPPPPDHHGGGRAHLPPGVVIVDQQPTVVPPRKKKTDGKSGHSTGSLLGGFFAGGGSKKSTGKKTKR